MTRQRRCRLIDDVKCSRALLLAMILYVTLDMALPLVPGAFVFDASESVEIMPGSRMIVPLVALPALARGLSAPAALSDDQPDRIAPPRNSAGREPAGARWRPRAALSAPASPEEPH